MLPFLCVPHSYLYDIYNLNDEKIISSANQDLVFSLS